MSSLLSASLASPNVVEKLMNGGSSLSQQDPAAKSVLIFDWDDTLLCSSWLASHGYRLDYPERLPADASAVLSALAKAVIRLLNDAKDAADEVMIITNAETGWVELSAAKFMPEVLEVLKDIPVLSARSTFEPKYPDNPLDWKLAAFAQEVDRFVKQAGTDVKKHVISIGDSVHERSALMAAMESVHDGVCKSIKFVERPTVDQLMRQVDIMRSCVRSVVADKDSMDLMLSIQLLYSN